MIRNRATSRAPVVRRQVVEELDQEGALPLSHLVEARRDRRSGKVRERRHAAVLPDVFATSPDASSCAGRDDLDQGLHLHVLVAKPLRGGL